MAHAKYLQQAQRHLPTTAPPRIPIGKFHRADPAGERGPRGNDKGDQSWLAGSGRLIKLADLIAVLLDRQSRKGPYPGFRSRAVVWTRKWAVELQKRVI